MKRLCGLIFVALVAAGCGDPTPEKQKTPGGVKFDVLKKGDGPEAKPGDWVRVHYTGTLSEKPDVKFDSSFDHPGKKPYLFQLGIGSVIAGWHEGITGMKVGEKRTLYIPSRLAYGPAGRLPKIPPNADLTFEVELVKIEKEKPADADD